MFVPIQAVIHFMNVEWSESQTKIDKLSLLTVLLKCTDERLNELWYILYVEILNSYYKKY